ncbi:hypothetical protein B0T16DRAFT_384845 [Cercophora newfieldiana]|uniref:Uncharacterized protein n=1 Tax=Cercophora newfieldiana TaxID=92897 RepID=A0AA40D0I5_9PEZI|nr:hypothetical protein B0T16DRAFT_384845 [Cercophora newfieldiana]
MQPSNNHRRRPDRNHGEQRDHGERSRRDRTGEFESHRYARRPRKHDGLGDGPEAITASRDVDEPQGNDYVQSWLRKTQESRVERSRPEGEEVQRRVPRKESPRAHLEMLRGKTKKRTRPAPSLSASLSGRSEHLEDRQFEKRARHKTLADKYEYRPDKKKVTLEVQPSTAATVSPLW